MRTIFSNLIAVICMLAAISILALAPIAAQEAPAPETPAAEAAAPAADAPAIAPNLTDLSISAAELGLRALPLTVDELGELAKEWQQIAKQSSQAVVDQQILMDSGAAGDPAAARDRMIALQIKRSDAFNKFGVVVRALENKGGDAAEVAKYRAYSSSVVAGETQAADWQTHLGRLEQWLINPEGGLKLVTRIGVILIALVALFTAARFIRRMVTRWIARVPTLSKLLQSFIVMVIYWIVIAFGLMIVLSMLGVDITPVFALIGGASFIIAFAMQDTLGNLAAGLMIMINRPFDEGDYVNVAGTGGTVKSVSIVSTTVSTPDNQVIVIPNSKVWGDIITNVTASQTRRVDLTFGIGYDDSIEDAQKVLEDLVAAHPLILRDPPAVIRVNQLAPSSVNFVVRPWAKRDDYWTVYWDLTRQVKEAFDERGISIPFPQTDFNVRMPKDLAALALPGRVAQDAGQKVGDPEAGTGRPRGAQTFAAGDDVDPPDEEER